MPLIIRRSSSCARWLVLPKERLNRSTVTRPHTGRVWPRRYGEPCVLAGPSLWLRKICSDLKRTHPNRWRMHFLAHRGTGSVMPAFR